MTEAFFYATSVYRLRARARWVGLVLLITAVLPVDVVAGHPQFLWQVLAGLPPASAVAALAPVLTGVALVAASRFSKRGLTLATSVLTFLASCAVLIHYGEAAAAWEALSLPPSVTERPVPALLSLAATSAGIHLAFKEQLRPQSRWLLTAGLVLAALFYAVPVRGESAGEALFDLLYHMNELPHWRLQLGFVILAILLAWPGLMALAAQWHRKHIPEDEQPILALATLYGVPLILGMLLYRGVSFSAQGWVVMVAAQKVAVLAGLLVLLSSTLEVLLEGLFSADAAEAELDLPTPPPHRKVLGLGAAVFGGIWLVQALLARPPQKGVDWTLVPATAPADALFGEAVSTWNEARLEWDQRVRQESGARDLVVVRAAGKALVKAAHDIDAGLETAFEALVRESQDLDLAGRGWYRLVGDVNEASRRAGLPYYLDPTVFEYATREGARRHFRVRGYRIDSVRTREVDGQAYAALHVSHVGQAYPSDARLGFSRDLQPFALVVKDEIATFTALLGKGSCGLAEEDAEAGSDTGTDMYAPCDALLKRLQTENPAGLADAISNMTSRHEIQHQIDGPELPMSTQVVRETAAFSDAARHRVNRELSAYLMEITTEDAPPHLALVHLYPFALGGGSAEHFVAVIVFEQLAGAHIRILDRDTQEVDEGAVKTAMNELSALPAEELRERALRVWKDLY